MLSYVQPTLNRATSDGIIIYVGTNVSAKSKIFSDIADSIISVGKKCQGTVVRDVMISSLIGKNK